jgi:hypothetical protein
MKKQFIVGVLLGFVTVFIVVIAVMYIFTSRLSFTIK